MIPTLTEVDTTAIDLVAEAHGVYNVTSILSHDGIEKVLNPMYNQTILFLWHLSLTWSTIDMLWHTGKNK